MRRASARCRGSWPSRRRTSGWSTARAGCGARCRDRRATAPGPSEPWRADPARARATRDAWRARRAGRGSGRPWRVGAAGGRATAPGARPDAGTGSRGADRPIRGSPGSPGVAAATASRGEPRRGPRKATPGSTTYDEAAELPREPDVGRQHLVRPDLADVLDDQPAGIRRSPQAWSGIPGAGPTGHRPRDRAGRSRGTGAGRSSGRSSRGALGMDRPQRHVEGTAVDRDLGDAGARGHLGRSCLDVRHG